MDIYILLCFFSPPFPLVFFSNNIITTLSKMSCGTVGGSVSWEGGFLLAVCYHEVVGEGMPYLIKCT